MGFHGSRIIKFSGLLLLATLCGATALAQTPTGGHAVVMPMRSSAPTVAGPSNPANIPYNGGRVIPHPNVYAFWWGNPTDFPGDTQDGIDHWFRVLDDTAYQGLADQYFFGKEANVHFGGNLYDYTAPPLQPVDTTTGTFSLAPEVCKVLKANGQKPDPNGIYVIYASNFPDQTVYCAFHGYDNCPDGTPMTIAYVPNAQNLPACWVQPPELNCNTHSNGLRAAANSTAHELMESMTDPNLDAWVNLTTGIEIGDLCNFTYKRCVTLNDGSKWQLQEIWSNKAGACRQGSGTDAGD